MVKWKWFVGGSIERSKFDARDRRPSQEQWPTHSESTASRYRKEIFELVNFAWLFKIVVFLLYKKTGASDTLRNEILWILVKSVKLGFWKMHTIFCCFNFFLFVINCLPFNFQVRRDCWSTIWLGLLHSPTPRAGPSSHGQPSMPRDPRAAKRFHDPRSAAAAGARD